MVFANRGGGRTRWESLVCGLVQFHHSAQPDSQCSKGRNDAQRGLGNAHINPNRDRQHGRIYRLVYEKNKDASIDLHRVDTLTLVNALEHRNMFWRLTAQRLLVDGNRQDGSKLLKLLDQPAPVSVHALWVLHGLGALDPESQLKCLISRDPALRRNAIRAIPHNLEGQKMLYDSAVLADKDLLVRLDAFVKFWLLLN